MMKCPAVVRLTAPLSFALLSVGVLASSLSAAELTVEKISGGVKVNIDGKPFTTYLMKSGHKPVLWPVIGPTGKPLTRSYPMTKTAGKGERADHLHHRSFWFTHGDVNGTSFWHEGDDAGNIIHRKFVKVESDGKTATIITDNDWIDADGKKVCEDRRTLVFGANENSRWIDFDVTVKASSGKVAFGDTKEGSFGVRVAGTMKVDAKLGGKIINSEGQTDRGAWGKAAAWVDYHGPVDEQQVGIAILNHPSSFRFPTYWHVRTYGLFTANPFGLHHFKGSDKFDGSYTLKAGESFTLKYRVLMHQGDEKTGKIAEAFEAYSKQ